METGFTYNVTFVVHPEMETRLTDYIRRQLMGLLFNPTSPACNPELRKVVEAGGEKTGPDHGLSIALSASFESEGDAHEWNDRMLIPALGDFHREFGPHSLFFVTLLQNLTV